VKTYRIFLCIFLSLFSILLNRSSDLAASTNLTHGPLLGAVTDTGVKIFSRTTQQAFSKVIYKKSSDTDFNSSGTVNTIAGNDYTATIALSGLAPNTSYDYHLVINGAIAATSTFKTLPVADQPAKFSFAVGADFLHSMQPFTVMDSVDAKNPAFNLFIGDTIYGDVTPVASTLDQFRTKYKENLSDVKLAGFLSRRPAMYTWDDHELQNNWDAGQTGLYIPARQAFDEYIATQNPNPRTAGTLYYSFKTGQTDFYVFDTRTFRSRNGAIDNSSKTLLGNIQKSDFKTWLTNSTAKFKVVVTSIPFSGLGEMKSDAWFGFQTERAELLNFIKDNNIKGVVFIGGDQHWSLVSRINAGPTYHLYEFVPTPLAAPFQDAATSADPQILFKKGGVYNYGFFTIDTTVTPATLTYVNYDQNNNSLYEITIDETDINPSPSTPPPPNPEIIIDNGDSRALKVGIWKESSSSTGAYNFNYVHDENTGKGTKSVEYTPTIPVDGNYDVYARWTTASNRSTNTPFVVSHQTASTTYIVNQQTQHATWVLLGRHTFMSGTSSSVTIKNDGTTGVVIADAVKWVPISASDTSAPLLTISTPHNLSYSTSDSISVTGTASDYTGISNITVNGINATSNNGFTTWTSSLSNLTAGTNTITVIATDKAAPPNTATQSVKVIFTSGSFDGNEDGIPDIWQVQYFGTDFSSDPIADKDADPDGDGLSNLGEYQAGTSPTDSQSTLIIMTQTFPSTGQFHVQWKSIVGKSYDIDYSMDLNTWINAATITASSSSTAWTDDGSKTGSSPHSTSRRFYRIKLQYPHL
jgi:phosphodiesterase/alkaline phosphatase D-like protein